jgi:hypothetical protein
MSSSNRSRRRNADQAALIEGGQFMQSATRRRLSNAVPPQGNPTSFQSPPPTMSQSRTRPDMDRRGTRHHTNFQSSHHHAAYAVTPSPNGGVNNNRPSSIRSNARQLTRSRGHYNDRSYGLGYYTHHQPTNTFNIDLARICYCDQPPCPPSCPHSQEVSLLGIEENTIGNCPEHEIIRCNAVGCCKPFHLQCIRMYKRNNSMQCSDPFMCCLHEHTKTWENATQEASTSVNKCKRYGIDVGPPIPSNRSLERKINMVKGTLQLCNVSEDMVEEIGRAPCLPYPSIVKMDGALAEKEAEAGRRFELSMLMFKVDACSCCGITQPHHIDPFFPKESPLPKYHLNTKYYDAWECNCWPSCNGQQFYGSNRPNMMAAFKSLHNNVSPDVFICGRAGASPNAKLCHDCCFEYQTRDDGDICDGTYLCILRNLSHCTIINMPFCLQITKTYLLDLRLLAPVFSTRNGFGGKPYFPPFNDLPLNVTQNIAKSRELSKLLSTFTSAEEAAIRQITPLISIVRLKEGNIGAKGNTHLVWQQSKLQLVLPNLPHECKFIIMKRASGNSNGQGTGNHGSSQIKSTKFERHKIARALELLVETVPDVWKATETYSITVSQARLDMWPCRGDLAELNPQLHIEEVTDATNNELHAHPNEGRVADGNDMGPSPLQNAEEPEEIFEGVLNYGGGSNVTSAASIPATIVHQINQHLQEGTPVHELHRNPPLPAPTMTRNNETATFNQSDLLSTDGFVNMNKTRYSWARAFPTVFIPEFLPFPTRRTTQDDAPYEWKWVIRHDISGWISPRDKQPKFERWYRHLMWRYDGVPAAHPTFSLALYNYKCQQSLQRQGQFVVNTSDIDPDTTIKDVFQDTDDERRKQAVEEVVNKAHCHSGNIVGTPRYWKNTFYEFEAVTQYHSHVLRREPSFFITNSLADHHEFSLRMMLHNYAEMIKKNTSYANDDLEQQGNILENDAIFSMHSQKYKTVVTHYFAAKVELWYPLVLQPLLGIDICTLVHEFQSGRGAIHSHLLAYSDDQPWNKDINNALHDYALHIHSSLKALDQHIKGQCSEEELKKLALHCHEKGMERRERFLSRSQEGKQKLKEFETALGTGREVLNRRIAKTMESYFGLSAMTSWRIAISVGKTRRPDQSRLPDTNQWYGNI